LTSAAEGRRFEILFVCLGNLCRSPMAEGMARGFIERDHGESLEAVEVSSAGLGALEGEPPTDEAVRVMAACDIDISGHRARRASPSVMASVDLVLAMEERHRERLMIMGVTAPVFVLLRLGEAAGEALKVREDTLGTLDCRRAPGAPGKHHLQHRAGGALEHAAARVRRPRPHGPSDGRLSGGRRQDVEADR